MTALLVSGSLSCKLGSGEPPLVWGEISFSGWLWQVLCVGSCTHVVLDESFLLYFAVLTLLEPVPVPGTGLVLAEPPEGILPQPLSAVGQPVGSWKCQL